MSDLLIAIHQTNRSLTVYDTLFYHGTIKYEIFEDKYDFVQLVCALFEEGASIGLVLIARNRSSKNLENFGYTEFMKIAWKLAC